MGKPSEEIANMLDDNHRGRLRKVEFDGNAGKTYDHILRELVKLQLVQKPHKSVMTREYRTVLTQLGREVLKVIEQED